jgi:hypothetical protein
MRLFPYASFALLFSYSVSAQNSPPQHQHSVNTAGMINGEIHPELIPDATAYRLYLLTISTMPNPTNEDRARQDSHIALLHLLDADRQALITILTDFKVRYASLVAQYNEAATAAQARGEAPDIKIFLQKRKDLVHSVMASLRLSLSTDAMAKLDSHIQLQKSSMKVDAQEAQ